MLLPLDYVRSTARSREVLTEIAGRVKGELGVTPLEVRLTGRRPSRCGPPSREWAGR